ncbi:prephenate dehydrogenase [Auraticoccus sp. F435]|uniref:Prephenate dehydrogenase n=1 Tax=Auraticoccus cholistanensis TaxID=2656650 RepID=A0A6A9V0M6_9ACTN|nr:prephenate dehydrogenase [Auraticoccus cholistanensis]MVA75889.1 prephenate dehydrogenase [Auraticoccus cholistanensis]
MARAAAVPQPVVVVGAGMVGSSVGCALTEAGFRVHLEDAVPTHAQVAASLGAGVAEPADPDAVGLVVVAVPPRLLADVVADALQRFPRAVVTDVGSVKSRPLAELERRGVDLGRYVGSHPMAGSHRAGPVAADPFLFLDRTWVVCEHPSARPEAVAAVEALVQACRARLVRMDPVEHDAAVARVSHLPHLVSSLVAGGLTDLPPEHLALAGQGVRDVTRIAGGDPRLWEQIVGMNADVISVELQSLQRRLERLREAVESGPEALVAWLEQGREGTRRIPGKHGGAHTEWSRLVVEIPDAPNALGRLFTDIGDAGLNVEDITIEHDPTRRVGYLSLDVEAEVQPTLAALLSDAGWSVEPATD